LLLLLELLALEEEPVCFDPCCVVSCGLAFPEGELVNILPGPVPKGIEFELKLFPPPAPPPNPPLKPLPPNLASTCENIEVVTSKNINEIVIENFITI